MLHVPSASLRHAGTFLARRNAPMRASILPPMPTDSTLLASWLARAEDAARRLSRRTRNDDLGRRRGRGGPRRGRAPRRDGDRSRASGSPCSSRPAPTSSRASSACCAPAARSSCCRRCIRRRRRGTSATTPACARSSRPRTSRSASRFLAPERRILARRATWSRTRALPVACTPADDDARPPALHERHDRQAQGRGHHARQPRDAAGAARARPGGGARTTSCCTSCRSTTCTAWPSRCSRPWAPARPRASSRAFDARATWDAMARATVFMAVPTIHAKLFAALDAADAGDPGRLDRERRAPCAS